MKDFTLKKAYFFIAIALLLSIAIRITNINRPLSKHHEFNTAMVLNVCNSWDIAGGPSKVNFTPIIFYGGKYNIAFQQGPNYSNGKNYYISLGPMQFVLPYYYCKILGLPFKPWSVQLFAMIIGIFASIILFKIILQIVSKQQNANFIATIGTILYIFLHQNLWFFSNAFSHESLMMPFYLLWILFVQDLKNKKKFSIVSYIFYTVIFALGIATDWLMVLCILVSSFYCVVKFNYKKESYFIGKIVLQIVVLIFSIAVIIYSYSAQLGFNNLIAMWQQKFLSRTIGAGNQNFSKWEIVKKIAIHFGIYFNVLLFFCLFCN